MKRLHPLPSAERLGLRASAFRRRGSGSADVSLFPLSGSLAGLAFRRGSGGGAGIRGDRVGSSRFLSRLLGTCIRRRVWRRARRRRALGGLRLAQLRGVGGQSTIVLDKVLELWSQGGIAETLLRVLPGGVDVVSQLLNLWVGVVADDSALEAGRDVFPLVRLPDLGDISLPSLARRVAVRVSARVVDILAGLSAPGLGAAF